MVLSGHLSNADKSGIFGRDQGGSITSFLKLSEMGPMVKISEMPSEESAKSSTSSAHTLSDSDSEHELDRDKKVIKTKATKMNKSHKVEDLTQQLLSPKADPKQDIDSCFNTTQFGGEERNDENIQNEDGFKIKGLD